MALLGLIVLAALLAIVLLPQYWVRSTIARHGVDRPDLPGTGGELAQHLIDRLGLDGVRLERTEIGDHYDPDTKTVRLINAHHDGRSVSAVAVATHEVAHALQHVRGERKLALRQRLAKFAIVSERIGAAFFIAAPLLALLVRSPVALVSLIGVGFAFMAVRVVVNLVTLPVEYDASFAKALPILKEGGYLGAEDMPAARSVLRAAAFTYVASALMSLINLARWLRMLR